MPLSHFIRLTTCLVLLLWKILIITGGLVTLFVDDVLVGQGRVDTTQPAVISLDETFEVGQVSV